MAQFLHSFEVLEGDDEDNTPKRTLKNVNTLTVRVV